MMIPHLITLSLPTHTHTHTQRTVFRLGKSVDNFRGALQTIHLGDAVLRVIVTLVKINRGIFLLFDHVLWAQRMKLVVIDNNFWITYSNRFWLLSIVLCLIRDFYEILKLLKAERKRVESVAITYSSNKQKATILESLRNVISNNPTVTIDLIKNSSDLIIPAARLDLVGVSGGVVGLMGVVSSLAGLLVSYNENLKLKFS